MFSNIQTAFSITKSKWNRYPIIDVDDMEDVSVANQYRDRYPYVWLKNKKRTILKTFNWNFTPEHENRHKIHEFPMCVERSKRPISWDALRLVPTSATSESETIHANRIASYRGKVVPMYVYSFNDRHALKKFTKLSTIERPCHIIRNKENMKSVYNQLMDVEDNLWLIDGDVTIHNYSDLEFSPTDDYDIYMFDVAHHSTGLIYADQSVQYITKEYFAKIKAGENIRIKHVSHHIGDVNDMCDPFKAWANAYYNTLYLTNTKISHLKKQRNKILQKYVQLSGSKLKENASAGTHQAENDRNNITDTTVTWSNILSSFSKWNDKNTETDDQKLLQKRLQSAKRIYGEDSDEYQKLSSQLVKSSL